MKILWYSAHLTITMNVHL